MLWIYDFSFRFTCLICMNVFLIFMSVYHMCAWCLKKSEKGIKSPKTRDLGGCEPPCGDWEFELWSSARTSVLTLNLFSRPYIVYSLLLIRAEMALAYLIFELHIWASISCQAKNKNESKMCVCVCVVFDFHPFLSSLSSLSHPSSISIGFCKGFLKYTLT